MPVIIRRRIRRIGDNISRNSSISHHRSSPTAGREILLPRLHIEHDAEDGNDHQNNRHYYKSDQRPLADVISVAGWTYFSATR